MWSARSQRGWSPVNGSRERPSLRPRGLAAKEMAETVFTAILSIGLESREHRGSEATTAAG